MSDIDADEILDMLQRAERIGAWKALNWVATEIGSVQTIEEITVEDFCKSLGVALAELQDHISSDFKREHAIYTSAQSVMHQRKSEQGKVKAE